MPDSLNRNDLRNLRRLYPEPPYRRYPYQYTYFGMGDGELTPTQKGIVQTDVMEDVGQRKLVHSRQHPVMRLRRHENVSSKQPYVFYTDPEVKRDIPDDGWPFTSYYYLMGVDTNGKPMVMPDKSASIPIRGSKMRGSDYVSPRKMYLPNRAVSREHPTGTVSFLSLEDLR